MRRAVLVAALVLATSAVPASAQIDAKCFAPALTQCGGVWHRTPVSIRWTVVPPFEKAIGCIDETLSHDTVEASRGCSAETSDGETATRGVKVKIDTTAPLVTGASPSRPPDANGWYRSPFQVAFSGTDATSGVLGCSSAAYGGPDGAATIGGTCTDRAGNVSAPGIFALRYDATPPSVLALDAVAGDHVVRLDWDVRDAASVELWRSPGRAGAAQSLLDTRPDGRLKDRGLRNGRRYEYRVHAVDEAGNAAVRVLSVVPDPRLLAPAKGAELSAPPLLRWTAVRHARYYNVQLFRRGRKVLTAWPGRPRLQLERSWRYGGERRRVKPGKYTWLVWPGRGARSKNDYGRLIGRRSFTIAP